MNRRRAGILIPDAATLVGRRVRQFNTFRVTRRLPTCQYRRSKLKKLVWLADSRSRLLDVPGQQILLLHWKEGRKVGGQHYTYRVSR